MSDVFAQWIPVVDGASLSRVVVPGASTETSTLDFKRLIQLKDPKAREKIGCDIAAFTNAWGGCIAIGVSEVLLPDGRKVAGAINGVEQAEVVREWLDVTARDALSPSALPYDLVIIRRDGLLPVIAINVPPLERGLACVWDRAAHTMMFPIRTSVGNKFLTPLEVEMRLADVVRARQIRLNQLVDAVRTAGRTGVPVVIASRVENSGRSMGGLELLRCQRSEIVLKLDADEVCVPYELVDAAWSESNDRIGLALRATLLVVSPRGMVLRAF